ncbi:MAG: HEAT repeat domain-containing protein [Pirellulales bacterium]
MCSLVIAMLCGRAAAFAQRDLKDIPPPDPELERQSLELADGLEINLYAADPLLAKPVQMNFDAAGRLWVATSETYPHIVPGEAANDKIIVLEDADHDGRAEKTTVFADGLLIPTGIEPGTFNGSPGAFVANSTELVFLGDSDDDLKSDFRSTLLSGFGTEDTHHLLHTLRWGPDGRLYMNQSIYIHSHIETPYGVRRLGGGGIWQYYPPTQRLEILSRGWINPWGHQHDKWGASFVTDGAGGEGINYTFPGDDLPTAPGAPRVLSGLNPGSPKYCGLEIISGRHFPDDWQGDLITCDFRAHRVVRFKLTESGSAYVSREQPEVIKTSHVAFRPIDVRMGPDGALYIADWYNPIIQHGEVDFRDPRRDHVHGRIWRVTAKGRKPLEPPQYDDQDLPKLYDQLRSPEAYTRNFAKRTVAEVEDVIGLQQWVAGLDAKAEGYDHARLEALWLMQTWEAIDDELLLSLLDSKDHHVRAAAVRVTGQMLEFAADLEPALVTRAQDEHPQVRLEAVCALRNIQTPEAVAAALAVLDRPMDEFLDFALWQTCREQKDVWLPTVLEADSKSRLYEKPTHLEFALRAVDEPAIVPPLVRLLNDGRLPEDRREGVLELIARLGTPQDLAMIFRRVLESPNQDAEQQLALLNSLASAATARNVRPAGDFEPARRTARSVRRTRGIRRRPVARRVESGTKSC